MSSLVDRRRHLPPRRERRSPWRCPHVRGALLGHVFSVLLSIGCGFVAGAPAPLALGALAALLCAAIGGLVTLPLWAEPEFAALPRARKMLVVVCWPCPFHAAGLIDE